MVCFGKIRKIAAFALPRRGRSAADFILGLCKFSILTVSGFSVSVVLVVVVVVVVVVLALWFG